MLEGHGREPAIAASTSRGRSAGSRPPIRSASMPPASRSTTRSRPAMRPARRSNAPRHCCAACPEHGLGYGILRHLDPQSGPALAALPEPNLLLNYLGRFEHAASVSETEWRPAPMPVQPQDDHDRSRAPILLEANAILDGAGALHVAWTFAPSVGAARTAALADLFVQALDALGRHCDERPLPAPLRMIAADFPEAQQQRSERSAARGDLDRHPGSRRRAALDPAPARSGVRDAGPQRPRRSVFRAGRPAAGGRDRPRAVQEPHGCG